MKRSFVVMTLLFLAAGIMAGAIAVMTGLVGDREPGRIRLDESDPRWIPRVAGSKGARLEAGQCGQVDEVIGAYPSMHRIECPK